MSGKIYLLDTNIIIGLFASEPAITEKIKIQPVHIFIPSVVIGELFYGAEQSTRNDIWIASLAAQHQLTLVTRDKHFYNIEPLLIESW